jgi:hypothetical protein
MAVSKKRCTLRPFAPPPSIQEPRRRDERDFPVFALGDQPKARRGKTVSNHHARNGITSAPALSLSR